MASSDFIDFQRTRDFSSKMNATFEFVKRNFKPLFRSMLYLVGPPALVVSLLLGSAMGAYFKAIFGAMSGGAGLAGIFTMDLMIKFALALLVATITGVITLSTINNYVILYREKQSNQIEVEEVWERVKKTFWMYFGTVIGWVILAFAGYIVLAVPIVLLANVSTGLVVLGIFIFIGVIFYLLVATSLVFVIRGFEPVGFFESFGRSLYLVRGKWWSTFGLFFIFYLIISVISSIFFLPWYVTKFVGSLHNISEVSRSTETDWFGLVSIAAQYLVSYLLAVLPQIGLIFQYFNLVERKESKGLLEKMEGLGSTEQPQTNSQAEHY